MILDLKVILQYDYIFDNCNNVQMLLNFLDFLLLDVFMFKKDQDLHGSALEKSQSLSDMFTNWWKMKNHKIAYKLLYMAQHGDKTERFKAVTALSSLSHLKGKFIDCYISDAINYSFF